MRSIRPLRHGGRVREGGARKVVRPLVVLPPKPLELQLTLASFPLFSTDPLQDDR